MSIATYIQIDTNRVTPMASDWTKKWNAGQQVIALLLAFPKLASWRVEFLVFSFAIRNSIATLESIMSFCYFRCEEVMASSGTTPLGRPSRLESERMVTKSRRRTMVGRGMVIVSFGVAGMMAMAVEAVTQTKPIKTTVEFKSCVGVSTVVSEKNVCYVMDLSTKQQKVVVELCSGVNISGGTIVLGGKASAMMCSTFEFPVWTDRVTAKKMAKEALLADLKTETVQSSLKRELEYTGSIKGVEQFLLKQDPAYEERLRRLLEDIEQAKRKK